MGKIFITFMAILSLTACDSGLGSESGISNDIEVDLKMDAIQIAGQNLSYKNVKYAFGLKQFPKDFEVEQLSNDAGIIFKKFVKASPSKNFKDPDFDYTAEIYIMPFENLEDYENLSDFISRKYAGYSFEFADYGEFAGYYVNEGVVLNAVSHFYSMSEDGKTIYEAYLKLPSKYYGVQKEVFEKVVENMVFF